MKYTKGSIDILETIYRRKLKETFSKKEKNEMKTWLSVDKWEDISDGMNYPDVGFDEFEEFAYAAMKALEELGKEDFVLLKNDRLREWWVAVKEQERKALIKKNALDKLTPEERRILGIEEDDE